MVLLVGFWFVPLAQTCNLSCLPGDLGDARFNSVVLEHFYRWVTGSDRSLMSPSFFYPMPGALTFSDNHWGTAWLYAVIRSLGWDRYNAFDIWYLSGYLSNFIVCHVVFRKLGLSPLASALGAFAFTFSLPVIATHGHAQLTFRCLIPAGLLLWQRFRESSEWQWLGWLAFATTAQFYIAIYLGYFMLLLIGAWAVAGWMVEGYGPKHWFGQWRRWKEPATRQQLIRAVMMIVVAALALAWLMHPYLHYSKVYGFQRAPEEIVTMLPRLQSYLLADASTVWGDLSRRFVTAVPMRPEQQMFFGVGILGLVAVALIHSTLRMRWVALVSILLLAVLTLSVGGHSLYMVIARLPGITSVRAVSRIVVVMTLPVALLVAIGVDAVSSARGRWKVLGVALVIMMIGESVATTTIKLDIERARGRIAQLASELPSPMPVRAVVFNPLKSDVASYDSELDGVILAQEKGLPTLNGYSGNIPPGYYPRADEGPCRQAWYRFDSAKGFFAERLKKSLPKGATGPIVVIGQTSCSQGVLSEIPVSEIPGISLRIESLQREGGSYRVTVAIANGSLHALATRSVPNPLRLSWQKVADQTPIDPDRWFPRVDIGGESEIMPADTRRVTFTVPATPGEHGHLVVSAVLEGRLWLHDRGVAPASAELPAPQL
ncbi:hypothetical protein HBF26_04740 [Luteibacter jiangsuensis]|uniref:Membrane protein YfhO n=1 Tax=Luteibacter jiangsuensis TaxID=637577 RepID=A0ABX0Q0Y3_9GAMM|nr:hypothetical protein [Luteibacter jiangsuensis]NID04180.1 hypothetical protein [Luteibacter jiangsuensis]